MHTVLNLYLAIQTIPSIFNLTIYPLRKWRKLRNLKIKAIRKHATIVQEISVWLLMGLIVKRNILGLLLQPILINQWEIVLILMPVIILIANISIMHHKNRKRQIKPF